MLDSLVPSSIDASVQDGIVTLTGMAPFNYQRAEAEFVAGNVPGIIGLDDQVELTIDDPTPADVRHSIKKAFKRDASLDAEALSIDTFDGTVTLSGHVDSWRRWGPYLSERAWGTVREDYSADGDAWSSFPHDHARSRAYRWSEDGLGGICDDRQLLCLAFAFWNGHDPILKERVFGLTGPEGNHGEDAKEYWWYLDSTPTHSWMRWRYVYPQAPFPYAELLAENARRDRHAPEYELLDTGVFDGDRYWDVTVDYAKAAPDDICVRVHVRNAGPDRATLHLLPTLWLRNRWSWDPTIARPEIREDRGGLVAEEPLLGRMTLSGNGTPEPLFCDNET